MTLSDLLIYVVFVDPLDEDITPLNAPANPPTNMQGLMAEFECAN
jgi:hypothetical protein